MNAVGVAARDEIGPVVQHEERPVRLAQAPERLGCTHDLLVRKLLVAQLDDVDAAPERSVEQRRGIVPVGARLQDETEAGAGEPGASLRAVHGGAAYRPHRGAV